LCPIWIRKSPELTGLHEASTFLILLGANAEAGELRAATAIAFTLALMFVLALFRRRIVGLMLENGDFEVIQEQAHEDSHEGVKQNPHNH